MPKLVFIAHDGTKYDVEAETGDTVMHAAMSAAVPGIVADCGGYCSCATCHGYIDGEWASRVPAPAADEAEMLEGVIRPQENSRLTCQVKITPELDGMIIHLPESQF